MKNIMVFGAFAVIALLLVGTVSALYGDTSVGVNAKSNSETSANASANAGTESRERNDAGETKEDIVARINLRTGLSISIPDNENEFLGAILRVYLSNGRYALVKVLPATASATAQANLKAKCEERNCTVELKEVSDKGEKRAAYNVEMEKKAKVLGFINAKMKVSADVDAETGEVIATHRPWWSFVAKEEDE